MNHAFYVWSSYALAFVTMSVEVLTLYRRRRMLRWKAGRKEMKP